jgi:alpha-glucosidase
VQHRGWIARSPLSQGFDRGQGGFGRAHKNDWKLTEFKKVFNYWNVEMEKAGGWNSN